MRRAFVLLLLVAAGCAESADIVVSRSEGKLDARINATDFPENLAKDLTSGLTNRLYARVSLLEAGRTLDQRAVEIALRYDLWDEKFTAVRTMSGSVVDTRSLATLADVNGLLRALPLPGLFDIAALRGDRELVLRVELLLNPIDREKMRMIRKWVSQNSTPAVIGDQGTSMSNAIFNRIFEQYSSDSDMAAVWRAVTSSPPFRISGLSDEAR
jgi:hypothetical protein